jgi:hypothetical protein
MNRTACNLELRASRRPFLAFSSHPLSSLPTLVRPRHIIARVSRCLRSSGRTRHWVCELVLASVVDDARFKVLRARAEKRRKELEQKEADSEGTRAVGERRNAEDGSRSCRALSPNPTLY